MLTWNRDQTYRAVIEISRCNCDSGCQCVINAGDNVTVTGTGSVENPYVISGDEGGLPVATAFTTGEMPNTYTESGTIVVVVLPSSNIVLALTTAGAAFPKVVLTERYLYFGDGTFDPVNGPSYVSYLADAAFPDGSGIGTRNLYAAGVIKVNGDSANTNAGLHLISPSGFEYQLVVDDAGVLSTVAYP